MEQLVQASDELDSAKHRGAIWLCDWILTAGLDGKAREMLGLKDPDPEPVEDYMSHDVEEARGE